jgi:hypothetical protein
MSLLEHRFWGGVNGPSFISKFQRPKKVTSNVILEPCTAVLHLHAFLHQVCVKNFLESYDRSAHDVH